MKKIYLAIPYSGMEESSYEQANLATVLLLNIGYNVISPITHCHSLTKIQGYDLPGTWEFWKEIDFEFIDWVDEVFVLIPKEGWKMVQNSTGVQAEIEYSIDNNKPVTFYKMEALKEIYKELK
jgi:hypothetical protein